MTKFILEYIRIIKIDKIYNFEVDNLLIRDCLDAQISILKYQNFKLKFSSNVDKVYTRLAALNGLYTFIVDNVSI